ncbi:MAG TPA: DUF2207 domain-containing protein, partial [Pseudonocardiaceae bacterium]
EAGVAAAGVAGAAAGGAATEAFVPVTGAPEVAVEFTPPEGLRPGPAGVLLDERVSARHVSATLVDLAVRGYLRVERTGDDWTLRWLGTPREGDELLEYERTLLDTLFAGRPEVRLSALRTTYAVGFQAVVRRLAEEVTRAGWFRRPVPGRVPGGPRAVLRLVLPLVALPILLGGGGGLLALVGAGWSVVVVLAGLLAAGVIGYLAWRALPARTAVGRALWTRLTGFRTYLETAEAGQLRAEEAAEVFSRYLPLAVVFGLTKRWARVFAALAAAQGTPATVVWYAGDGDLGDALDDFTTRSGTALSATAPSAARGASGFGSSARVGRGGGGGGGRGW